MSNATSCGAKPAARNRSASTLAAAVEPYAWVVLISTNCFSRSRASVCVASESVDMAIAGRRHANRTSKAMENLFIGADAKGLFAPVAGKGGGQTETDEHTAGDVTFPAQVAPVALDPSPRRAGDHRIKTITRQAHQGE